VTQLGMLWQDEGVQNVAQTAIKDAGETFYLDSDQIE
jgi:hypothetical protein